MGPQRVLFDIYALFWRLSRRDKDASLRRVDASLLMTLLQALVLVVALAWPIALHGGEGLAWMRDVAHQPKWRRMLWDLPWLVGLFALNHWVWFRRSTFAAYLSELRASPMDSQRHRKVVATCFLGLTLLVVFGSVAALRHISGAG
jgi:hypothetical protein